MSSWDLGCWHPVASMAQGQWSWVRFGPAPRVAAARHGMSQPQRAGTDRPVTAQSPLSVFNISLGPCIPPPTRMDSHGTNTTNPASSFLPCAETSTNAARPRKCTVSASRACAPRPRRVSPRAQGQSPRRRASQHAHPLPLSTSAGCHAGASGEEAPIVALTDVDRPLTHGLSLSRPPLPRFP